MPALYSHSVTRNAALARCASRRSVSHLPSFSVPLVPQPFLLRLAAASLGLACLASVARTAEVAPGLPRALGFPAGPPAAGPAASPPLQLTRMGPLVVTASRTPQGADTVAATLRVLPADTLRHTPAATLDAALRSVPGFGLFRRSDSFSANPTAQGVSLRGLGPSGASRSLLLLDGVPLNDPFGGWVAWSKLPREGLARAEIVPGGGATAWGNAALGGVLQLFSLPLRPGLEIVDRPPEPIRWIDTGSLTFAATAGDYGTRSAELAVLVPTPGGAVQLLGRAFHTDGFRLVAPERRGPIDVPAGSEHHWLTLRWKHALTDTLHLVTTARAFEERRNNGTPYQHNGSREKFLSVDLAAQPRDHFAWHATAYAQSQGFASTFSGVNATRTAETPASDQFAVPATALGAAWTGTWQHAGEARTNLGADTRFTRGETREHFTFAAGQFTRLRVAGGRQHVAGLFALHERALTSRLRATGGVRLDRWTDTDGHRREGDRFTGTLSRADRYADRDGTSFSPSAGFVFAATGSLRLRANAQQAFRRPTLNELYRPFRVGPNVTEANAALGTERVRTAELGATWTPLRRPTPPSLSPSLKPPPSTPNSSAPAPSAELLTFAATAFHNDLRDAVGNVTLARGPGTYPLFGFIAAGGVGRQRLNLDRTRVRGLEFSVRCQPAAALGLTADYLYNDATVRRATIAPALVGRRVAQVPRHSASLGATWRAPAGLTFTPRARGIGRQFEDDENQLILGAVVLADLGVSRALTPHLELFLSCENLFAARLETGRTADGIVNVGTPRLVLLGLRGAW
jgi:outer membrane receptor protein involved in Fe transport